jgi:hypothetical protein
LTRLPPPQDRVAPEAVAPSEPASPAPPVKPKGPDAARARTPSVQYVDVRSTDRGREYSLRVLTATEPRLFVLVIPGEAFVSGGIRFQDGPDLCFRRLSRDLTADPDLLPGDALEISAAEIRNYRVGQEQPAQERRKRGSAT